VLRQRNGELDALKNPPKQKFSREPLYYSEAQEDVIYARGAELIGVQDAENLLRALDFENTQVYLDDSMDQ